MKNAQIFVKINLILFVIQNAVISNQKENAFKKEIMPSSGRIKPIQN